MYPTPFNCAKLQIVSQAGSFVLTITRSLVRAILSIVSRTARKYNAYGSRQD
jgi:hypothetical protein